MTATDSSVYDFSSSKRLETRQAIIAKIRAEQVDNVLAQDLRLAVAQILNVSQDSLPELPALPLRLGLDESSIRMIRRPEELLTIFDENARSLVILGRTTVEKSHLLHQLARALLDRAATDATQPIPIILNLKSWHFDPHSSLEPAFFWWCAFEIERRYDLPAHLAAIFLGRRQLFPIVDGVEAAGRSEQERFIEAIEELQAMAKETLPLCVAGYPGWPGLPESRRIVILPVQQEELSRYLTHPKTELSSVYELIRQGQLTADLASGFDLLMLAMMTVAYHQVPNEPFRLPSSDSSAWYKPLCKTYVSQALMPLWAPNIDPCTTRLVRWLHHLARQMTQNDYTQLGIDDIRPGEVLFDWLPKRWAGWHKVFKFSPDFLTYFIVLTLVYAGLGPIYGRDEEIWPLILLLAAIAMIAITMLVRAIQLELEVTQRGLSGTGTILQGIKSSIVNGARGFLAGLLIGGLVSVVQAFRGEEFDLFVLLLPAGSGVFLGAVYGFSATFARGYKAAKDYLQRFLLGRSGKLPFDPALFLNQMSARRLMYRSGTCYGFIHEQLQAYLAELTDEEIEQFPRGNLKTYS